MSSEPWTTDVDRLLAHALASNLVSQRDLQQAYARWHSAARGFRADKTAAAFGDYLVEHQLLTRWQCDRLRAGKYRGFFLDNYKVVEYLRKEGTDDKYLATDLDNGERVVLAVAPPSIAPFKNGRPGYRITRSPAGRAERAREESSPSTADDLQTSIFVSDEPEPAPTVTRPVASVPRTPITPELAKIINPEPQPRRWRWPVLAGLALLIVAGSGYYFFGGSEPEVDAGSLAESLRVGMSAQRLDAAVRKYRPGEDWEDAKRVDQSSGLARYMLENGECLVVEFGKLADPSLGITPTDRVSDFEFVNFSDLSYEMTTELLPAIQLIHESRPSRPSTMIRATNVLYHLGQEQAIDALREYYELATRDPRRTWAHNLQPYASFPLARILFVAEDGSELPSVRDTPRRSGNFALAMEVPQFPMHVEQGIPFALIGGQVDMDTSNLVTPSQFFRYCDRNGKLRRDPLVPTISPVEAGQRLLARSVSDGAGDRWDRTKTSMIQLQVISCLRDLGDPDLATKEQALAAKADDTLTAENIWTSVLSEYGQEKIQWDAKNGRFRRK